MSRREANSASILLKGQVIDEEGVPLAGGTLILSCLEDEGRMLARPLKIREEGRFSGSGCPQVCAQLNHPSMVQDEPWVFGPGEVVELVARALPRLEGTVSAPDGEPVPAARLLLVQPRDEVDPFAVPPYTSRHATTDADGAFFFTKIERPPCDPCMEAAGRCDPEEPVDLPTIPEMILSARAPGFRMAEVRIDTDRIDPLEIRLESPAAPIVGTLLDPQGRAYPRARVLAQSTQRPQERHGVSVAEGRFSLGSLGDGAYDLRAVQDGRELGVLRGVEPGGEVGLVGTFPALGVDLTLVVEDAAGAPVAGVSIDGGPFAGVRTDANGQTAALSVIPGTYRLRIRPPRGGAAWREVVVGEGESPARVVVSVR